MSGQTVNSRVDLLSHDGSNSAIDGVYDERIQREIDHNVVAPPVRIEPVRFGELPRTPRPRVPKQAQFTDRPG